LAKSNQQPMDRDFACQHGRREPANAFPPRPRSGRREESSPDAQTLERIGDGDRDLSRIRAVRLDAKVPDDLLVTHRPVDDRNESLSVVVIGGAERD
jgi:hypothetical protein